MSPYLQSLRAKVGQTRIIHPAARIIVENKKGEYLFIERQDNGLLGIPAGAFEEGETIEQCIRREVKEETGLEIKDLTLIGLSTHPDRETTTYPNGDCMQYFTAEFYSDSWEGELRVGDKEEVRQAMFLPPEKVHQLPYNEQSAFESLDYYRANGRVMLK